MLRLRSGNFAGASLHAAFLLRSGRNNPEFTDVAASCGKNHPPSAIQKSKAKRRSLAQEKMRSGFRLRTPIYDFGASAKRLNLPVTILRGITRSHPEHGS